MTKKIITYPLFLILYFGIIIGFFSACGYKGPPVYQAPKQQVKQEVKQVANKNTNIQGTKK